MARLVIFDETVRGVDLPNQPVILGRSQKADVPIRDSVLSRKHCTIVPTASGLSLIDLKSSNGTYLNGSPIEKSELKFDDVIEIGNTVIVILDTETWNRGEGLTRLRNPVKAQELIQTIKKRAILAKNGGAKREHGKSPARQASVALREKKHERSWRKNSPFVQWAEREIMSQPVTRELLEGYAYHRVISLLARRSPDLRRALARVMDRVLEPETFSRDAAHIRDVIRRAVTEALEGKQPEELAAGSSADGGEDRPTQEGRPKREEQLE